MVKVGDVFICEVVFVVIDKLFSDFGLKLVGGKFFESSLFRFDVVILVEVVVQPRTRMEG